LVENFVLKEGILRDYLFENIYIIDEEVYLIQMYVE
jgi:hypothetical protein